MPRSNYHIKRGDCYRSCGAWQVGARFSYLDINDKGIRGGQVCDWTLGLNWFLNPNMLQFDESLDVGSDTQTGVNDTDYQPPFKFTGKIHKITLSIDHPKLSAADIKKLQEVQREKAIRD